MTRDIKQILDDIPENKGLCTRDGHEILFIRDIPENTESPLLVVWLDETGIPEAEFRDSNGRYWGIHTECGLDIITVDEYDMISSEPFSRSPYIYLKASSVLKSIEKHYNDVGVFLRENV